MEPIFRLPPDIEFQEVVTPLSEAMDWSIGFLGIDQVWKKTAGEGVLIIVLDTGVDHTHPDLINQIVARKDFTRSINGTMDSVGHGTHCAGIAAAEGNNGVGVISPAYKAKLACGKVLGAAGGREADLAAGINWACDLADEWPMAVLSTSWGGPTNSPLVEAALKRFTSKPKRISVAAAGNDGVNGRPGYPSVLDYCVCVAAGNRNGTLTEFSSRSPRVDTVGPGEGIVSTMPGGRYAEMSGTSMACPLVASVAACMLAADALDKDVDLADYKAFRAMLRATNKPMQDSGGYGLLNPPSLLEQVTDLDSPPAAEPRLVFDHAGLQIYKPARAGDTYSLAVNLQAFLEALEEA